jgi:hypothetical protein
MRELGSNQKGAIAEAAIRLAAIRCEVDVYMPVSGHSRADLVFDVGDQLYRVQVKWGRLSDEGDVVQVRLSGSRYTPNGYVYSQYDESEVDLFAVYCEELDRCFLLPISVCANRRAIHLRLSPPRNNQRACINLADEFAFEGAVAQLGEHSAGSRKVRGSIPLSSTSSSSLEPAEITVGSNPFRDHLGYWMDLVAEGQEVVVTRHGKPRLRLVAA